MVAQTTSVPCSASNRHSRALRIADRRRSPAVWPRSSAITARSASPSRKVTGRPAAHSRLRNSRPTVVLPAPDNPVIQKTRPGEALCSASGRRPAFSSIFVSIGTRISDGGYPFHSPSPYKLWVAFRLPEVRVNHPVMAYGQETHLRFRGREVSPTQGSCRFPLIVLQQTTQSFLATHDSAIPARPSIRQGEQQSVLILCWKLPPPSGSSCIDRKSTRLNSSHLG